MIRQKRTARNRRKSTPSEIDLILPPGPLNDYPIRMLVPDRDNPKKATFKTLGGCSHLPSGLTFHKTIFPSQFLHTPRAIGYSTALIAFLRRNSVEWLLVTHAQLGTQYRSSLAHFLDNAFTEQRDVDLQMFLPIEYWNIIHPILIAETPEPSPQLALFGGAS